LAALLLCLPAAASADDAIARADEVLRELVAASKARDVPAVIAALGPVPAIHDGIEDRTRRRALQKAVGAVMRTKALAPAHGDALAALARMNDPAGVYRLDFILLARNDGWAWRYGIKPADNDTSMTAWAVLALGTARLMNRAYVRALQAPPFVLDDAAFEGAMTWIRKVMDPETGRAGYVRRGGPVELPLRPVRGQRFPPPSPPRKTETMTAAALLVRVLAGEDPTKDPASARGAALVVDVAPTWDPAGGRVDLVYWFFGGLALHMRNEPAAWYSALRSSLETNQRREEHVCGRRWSWDPVGVWGKDAGRVYATAMGALALLSRHRLPPWPR
jgi:hypothetical protein